MHSPRSRLFNSHYSKICGRAELHILISIALAIYSMDDIIGPYQVSSCHRFVNLEPTSPVKIITMYVPIYLCPLSTA